MFKIPGLFPHSKMFSHFLGFPVDVETAHAQQLIGLFPHHLCMSGRVRLSVCQLSPIEECLFLQCQFWLIWHTCQWAYIIMIHDFITIWDHDLGSIGICSICVCFSWSEYWSQKLHILQVYHIMPLINAHGIFSWYHMYFLTGSHFAQILKVALLSILLN